MTTPISLYLTLGALAWAAPLFAELVFAEQLADFLTLPAYAALK